jgi:hypothetical protein
MAMGADLLVHNLYLSVVKETVNAVFRGEVKVEVQDVVDSVGKADRAERTLYFEGVNCVILEHTPA